MATALLVVSTAMTLFSGMQQASAMEAQGKQQQAIAEMQAQRTRDVAERNALIIRDQAEYKAARLEEQGKKKQASAQREFIERRRITRLTASRAEAIAGATGGGVGDPTMLNIMAGIKGEGEFGAQTALFEGESAASLLSSQAALTLYEGEQKAAMTEYTGEAQAGLKEYEGATARYTAEQGARTTRFKAIGTAALSAGSLMSKYSPTNITAAYTPSQTYTPSYGGGMLTTGY